MPGIAAVSAETTRTPRVKMTHEQRKEKRRAYMQAKYLEPEFRAQKRTDMAARYHQRVPDARYGVRGRRPRVPPTPPQPSPIISDDAASAASTPRSIVPAAAVILAGGAVGAALAAIL